VQRAPQRLAVLFAPAVLCYALLYIDGAAHLFVAEDDSYRTGFGPLWWGNAGYSWLLGVAGSIQFLKARSRSRDPQARLRGRIVGAVSLAPTLGNTAWVLNGLVGPDPTPILLLVAAIAIRTELFAGDLLQMLPVSRHDLLSHIPTPLILIDPADRVTEINPAAQTRLGISRDDALDRNIDVVLEEALDSPRFERWSLVAGGREAGQILVPARKAAIGGEW
jgi:PAS domain-containing protein